MQPYLTTRTNKKRKLVKRSTISVLSIGICASLIWTFSPLSASSQPSIPPDQQLTQSVASFDDMQLSKSTAVEYNGKVRKIAYLTFDDGPSKYTEKLLDVLKQQNVEASFFMLGPNVLRHRDVVDRMNKEGHYPGLHSMTHDHKTLYRSGGPSNFIKEFTEAQEIVESIVGYKPTLIRAPYGSAPQIGPSFRDAIAKAGFKMWDWTIDSNDWRYSNKPKSIVNDVRTHLSRNIEVLLFHEKQQTIDALPEIIHLLHSRGYELEAYHSDSHIVVNFPKDDRL